MIEKKNKKSKRSEKIVNFFKIKQKYEMKMHY